MDDHSAIEPTRIIDRHTVSDKASWARVEDRFPPRDAFTPACCFPSTCRPQDPTQSESWGISLDFSSGEWNRAGMAPG